VGALGMVGMRLLRAVPWRSLATAAPSAGSEPTNEELIAR